MITLWFCAIGAALGPLTLAASRRLAKHGAVPITRRTAAAAAFVGAAVVGSGGLRSDRVEIVGVYAVAFCVLFCLSVVDLVELRLPDVVLLPALGVGAIATVVARLATGPLDWTTTGLLTATAGFTMCFFVVHWFWPRALGFGDVKLSALLGLMLGWHASSAAEALLLIGWAMVTSATLGLLLAFVRRVAAIPFGPALSAGTWLVIVAATGVLR